MKIFHAILIVLNFLLAIACIAFGYFLFDQREILKERTITLEAHAASMADTLHWGDYGVHDDKTFPERYGDWAVERESDEQAMLGKLQDHQRMHTGLRQLEGVAADRMQTLVANKKARDLTDAELAETQQDLAASKIDATGWRDKFDAETEAHEISKDDFEAALAKLESAQLALRAELTERETQIDVLEQTIGQRDVAIEGLNKENTQLATKIIALTVETPRDTIDDDSVVMAVQSDYRFVVIEKPSSPVLPNQTALVHRGEDIVGKIKVSHVKGDVCVAQVLPGWTQENEAIRPGDEVLF